MVDFLGAEVERVPLVILDELKPEEDLIVDKVIIVE